MGGVENNISGKKQWTRPLFDLIDQFAEYGRTWQDLMCAEPFFATKKSHMKPSMHVDAVVAVLCAVDSLSTKLKENLAIKLIFLTQSSLSNI